MRWFGAYLQSITAGASWNDGATCQLTIVEDPTNGITANIPEVGSKVYVSIGSFYFGGILQRATYKESLGSGYAYDLVIESVTKLLDGVQIILADFNSHSFSQADPYSPSQSPEFTAQIPNILNIFAHQESQGFGFSDVNYNGFPAATALDLISLLARGGSQYGGNIVFSGYRYNLDLSELKSYISDEYRLSGQTQSLASIVQDICDVAGLDYFCTLYNTEQEISTIKISVVDKKAAPDRNRLYDFIQEARDSKTLISSDYGREFATPVAQKLVIGGPASRMIIQTSDTAFPLWGKTNNNQWVYSNFPAPDFYNNPLATIPVLLDELSQVPSYTATIFELRMAMGGFDAWAVFKSFETASGVERNGFNNYYTAPWRSKISVTGDMISRLISGQASSIDFQETNLTYAQQKFSNSLAETASQIYAAVSRVANGFYGQKFVVRLDTYEPALFGGGDILSQNVRWLREEVQPEYMWDIVDSAYYEGAGFNDVSFYDGDGRLKNGVAWPGSPTYDYSALGSNWCLTPDGGIASVNITVEKDPYFFDGIPHVIVDTGAQILAYDGMTTPDFGLSVLIFLFTGQAVSPSQYFLASGQNLQIPIPPLVVPPSSFGIAQQSKQYRWGPWYAWSSNIAGKSEVIFDESLVPENFAGDRILFDEAAFATAGQSLAAAIPNETGSIEVVGLPEFNIADRLGGSGPYISNIDISVGIDGPKTTYKFETWTPKAGKLSKYNIDRIKTINKNTMSFSQQQRSKITKPPLPKIKFEKSDLAAMGKSMQPNVNMISSFINRVGAGL